MLIGGTAKSGSHRRFPLSPLNDPVPIMVPPSLLFPVFIFISGFAVILGLRVAFANVSYAFFKKKFRGEIRVCVILVSIRDRVNSFHILSLFEYFFSFFIFSIF